MRRNIRFTTEQMIAKLREAEVKLPQGKKPHEHILYGTEYYACNTYYSMEERIRSLSALEYLQIQTFAT